MSSGTCAPTTMSDARAAAGIAADLPDGVVDARASFAARLLDLAVRYSDRERRQAAHMLEVDDAIGPGSFTPPRSRPPPTVLIPGLLGDTVATFVAPLLTARQTLALQKYDIDVAWVSGRAGCDRNADRLRAAVLARADAAGEPIVLIGYSKGCADALHMLVRHRETIDAIHAFVSLAGVVGGTPLVANVPRWLQRALARLPLPGLGEADERAVPDLARVFRRAWLEEHPLPPSIRYASIVAVPTPEQVSRILKPSYRKLSQESPRNDSQVIDRDAMLPRSELLACVNADHWAIALPIAHYMPFIVDWLVNRNDFPRTLLLQAVIDHMGAAPLARETRVIEVEAPPVTDDSARAT